MRNPISRTLSGYLDKIIGEKEYARLPIMDKLNEHTISVRDIVKIFSLHACNFWMFLSMGSYVTSPLGAMYGIVVIARKECCMGFVI